MFCSAKKTLPGPSFRWPLCACLLMCVSALFLTGCPIGAVFALFAKKDPLVQVVPEYEFSDGNLLVLVNSPAERTGLSAIRPLLTRELLPREKFTLPPSQVQKRDLTTLRSAIRSSVARRSYLRSCSEPLPTSNMPCGQSLCWPASTDLPPSMPCDWNRSRPKKSEQRFFASVSINHPQCGKQPLKRFWLLNVKVRQSDQKDSRYHVDRPRLLDGTGR